MEDESKNKRSRYGSANIMHTTWTTIRTTILCHYYMLTWWPWLEGLHDIIGKENDIYNHLEDIVGLEPDETIQELRQIVIAFADSWIVILLSFHFYIQSFYRRL